ncbi:MAG: response regulator [Deltaproteobacteria bacterium]|nr:response regulator [Deltaproteobacteria bacterium]
MTKQDHDRPDGPTILPPEDDPFKTIDLDMLFAEDTTESGSIDLRSVKIAYLGRLLQAMSVPTLLVTEEEVVQFANTAFLRIVGDKFEPVGKAFQALFPNPDEARTARSMFSKVLESRKSRVIERTLQIHRTRIWARMHSRTIRLGRERMVLIQIENLNAEKQLAAIRKYKRLVDIFPMGIVELAVGKPVSSRTSFQEAISAVLEARIVDGNNEFAAMHGRTSARDLHGVKFGDLFPVKGGSGSLFEKWIREGFPVRSFETAEVEQTKGARFFEETLIGNMSGSHLVGLWWLRRDLSDKKRQEEEFTRTQKLESVGVLAGGIAHDFNNLLTGIMGNLSLLHESANLGEQDRKRLEAATKASLRARDLTLQLLTFSRGGSPIRRTGSMSQLLMDAAEFSLRGSNVRSEFSIPDDLWSVDMDEGQMHQVIHNLLINAVQAMPLGGVVRVKAENIILTGDTQIPLPAGRYVRISVQDEGNGIEPENISKVFDPYFTTKKDGTGLGLATGYSVVRKHGGLLTVSSRVGEGATFYFFLPASCQQPRPKRAAAMTSPSRGGRILFMDDDETIREMAGDLLAAMGYEAVIVRDGKEAINAYVEAKRRGVPFDVVIMDLTVRGGMGGKEALEELLRIDPTVKAVASSGYSYSPVMADFARYGFADVLTKPYDVAGFNRVLQHILCKTGGALNTR